MTAPLIAIASGKGGVGKTSLTLNLAALLARGGARVLLLDGDTGLANLDVQLNLHPEQDLSHVAAGTATVEQIALPVPQLAAKGSVTLLPGRSGHWGLATLPQPQLTGLLAQVRALGASYTHVLIDVAAGVAPAQLLLCAQADATVLVTTPDPSSLTDAYALLKLLWQRHGCANARLLVNQATEREGGHVHTRLRTAATAFLQLPDLPYLGNIPADRHYAAAVKAHQLAAVSYPSSPAVQALQRLLPRLAPAAPA